MSKHEKKVVIGGKRFKYRLWRGIRLATKIFSWKHRNSSLEFQSRVLDIQLNGKRKNQLVFPFINWELKAAFKHNFARNFIANDIW